MADGAPDRLGDPLPFHGGDPTAMEAAFGRPAGGWLDLSTGINPDAYPTDWVDPACLRHLPFAGDLDELLAAARACYGVPAAAGIASASGTQAVLQCLPEIVPAGRVAILAPTYDEHAHLWRMAGRDVAEVDRLEALAEAELAVLVNPNNPDGRLCPRGRLFELAEGLSARGGVLVVDEAFADADPAESLAGFTDLPGILVLRSFGKFFGLAGMRLGFAMAARPLIDAITARLGPWAVSSLAVAVGARALADADWIAGTRARLADGRARLDGLLAGAGLTIIGGTDLFRLVETGQAARLHDHLAGSGILVRRFPARGDWLRIGLPDSDGFRRLDAALAFYPASLSIR